MAAEQRLHTGATPAKAQCLASGRDQEMTRRTALPGTRPAEGAPQRAPRAAATRTRALALDSDVVIPTGRVDVRVMEEFIRDKLVDSCVGFAYVITRNGNVARRGA